MIDRARRLYAELLTEDGTHRTGQQTLAFLRDFIADYERRPAEEVQDQYERIAFDARIGRVIQRKPNFDALRQR